MPRTSMQPIMRSLRDVINALYQAQLQGFQPPQDPLEQAPPWMRERSPQEILRPVIPDMEEGTETSRPDEPIREGYFPVRSDDGHGEAGTQPPVSEGMWDTPLGKDVKTAGVEALAWYVPYHSSRRRWGIYFRETGLIFLADYLET